MKKTFILILMLAGFAVQGQNLPVDQTTGLINISQVVPVENVSQSELYNRAKLWFVETFKSANDVLQMDDRQAGILTGKAFSQIYIPIMGPPTPYKLWYTVKLAVKDGRYKYEITNLLYEDYPNQYNGYNTLILPAEKTIITDLMKANGKPRRVNQNFKAQTLNQITALEKSIIAAMSKQSQGTVNGSDW